MNEVAMEFLIILVCVSAVAVIAFAIYDYLILPRVAKWRSIQLALTFSVPSSYQRTCRFLAS